MAKPDTLKADREKIRAGPRQAHRDGRPARQVQAHADREAVKPYLFVHAKAGKWEVLHTPAVN